jgi:hypothetical protein
MFVRLTLADVNEGEMDNALEYVKNTVIPSYDGIPGLLGLAACASNDGRFMAWSTWANEEAKDDSIDQFNQALAGAAEMLSGQPEVMEGPMVAGQQYIEVSKDGGEGFFTRFGTFLEITQVEDGFLPMYFFWAFNSLIYSLTLRGTGIFRPIYENITVLGAFIITIGSSAGIFFGYELPEDFQIIGLVGWLLLVVGTSLGNYFAWGDKMSSST